MPFFRSPFFLYRSQQWALWVVILLFAFVFFYRQQLREKALQSPDVSPLLESQLLWDSLHQLSFKKKAKIWPLSLNYLTDYQAYTLNISPEAFDLFQAFRKQGKWINSFQEFQEVTHLSDAKIEALRPYFKENSPPKKEKKREVYAIIKKDINKADQEDFKKIYGIGSVLAQRLIKYRTFLNGFSIMDQCYEVYGLDSTVVSSLKKHFKIVSPPHLQKKNINTLNLKELSKTPYISRTSAKKIIAFRTANGKISVDDLTKVLNDSLNKIERIKLYLY